MHRLLAALAAATISTTALVVVGPPAAPTTVAPAPAAGGGAATPAYPSLCTDPFPDVACTHRFADTVHLLVEEGLANGYADGTFRPTAPVSRQAFVAFLWRRAGEPTPTVDDPGFSDVPVGHPFRTPIAWAVEEGITDGWADGTFRPTIAVSRLAATAFVHRSLGSPSTPLAPTGPFSDVGADHPLGPGLAWAAHHRVVGGYVDGTFHPTDPVSRQAASSFLFRSANLRTPCERVDDAECFLPYPSSWSMVPDPFSDTGLRVDVDPRSLPPNTDGDPVIADEWMRNDGFSPGTPIMALLPGVDLTQSGAPPITDIQASLLPDSPVVLLDADTGERHPVWAELDSHADGPEEAVLIIRPGVNLTEGHRYVVALRHLRDGSGELLEPVANFASLSGGDISSDPATEQRRAMLEQALTDLEADGIDRSSLQLAWDFTVASERNLAERLLWIRDDAFAQLGGAAPAFEITAVTESLTDDTRRTVHGTFEVPLYLTGTGAAGSSFRYAPGDLGRHRLPARNGTYQARFQCQIPRAAFGLGIPNPSRLSLYGHGLLGDRGEVDAGNVRSFGQRHNITFCATDWIGMATDDIGNAARILDDISGMPTLADRSQQGILNTLFLGRLMKHPAGLIADPAFRSSGQPLISTAQLAFDGNSQGAIMGGAATAVAQDWTRAVLGVPGMNYSTLLDRSVDFSAFLPIAEAAYPRRIDRLVGFAFVQSLWDRAETNGYANHLTDDPLPGTPAHQVLLQVAFGDHQVATVTAEIEGRTIGASAHEPALADGRHTDVDPLWGLPAVGAPGFTGSVLVYWDSGTPAPPLGNVPPTTGADSHEDPRRMPAAQDQKEAFLFDGIFLDTCSALPCLADPA